MAWPINASDVRKALSYRGSEQGDESELTLYAHAATERVETMIGACTGQTIASTVRGPKSSVLLPHVLASIQSVTVDAETVDPSTYTVDLTAGILRGYFPAGTITVTGTAPAAPPSPAVIEVATRELAAIWYGQVHTPRAGGRAGGAMSSFTPLGFAIPREIEEKLSPFMRLPGIG